jgi:hypothetical protein
MPLSKRDEHAARRLTAACDCPLRVGRSRAWPSMKEGYEEHISQKREQANANGAQKGYLAQGSPPPPGGMPMTPLPPQRRSLRLVLPLVVPPV